MRELIRNIQEDNKLSILSVSSRDLTKPFKGGTRLILSSLGALALGGYKTTHLYLTSGKPKEPYTITVTEGKEVASLEIIEIFGRKTSWISKLEKKPDLILCERRPLFLLSLKLSKYFKSPLILRIDALYSFWALERARYTRDIVSLLKAPFGIVSYLLMAKRANYGICVTKILERKLRSFGIKNITTVEPTYLTISEMGKQTNNDFELSKVTEESDYVIVSTSDYRVIKSIASETSDFRYVIVGNPPTKEIIKELSANIVWTGIISDPKLIQLYEKALCVMIFRPWLSGISMMLLEALHFGKPCIVNSAVADSSGVEYQNINGILVADDISTWSALAKKFRNDRLFKSQSEIAAKRFFDQRFSWKIHVAKMKSVFDILLER